MNGNQLTLIVVAISLANTARIDVSRHASNAGREQHQPPNLMNWLREKASGWKLGGKSTACGLASGSVARAGQVWKPDTEGMLSPSTQQPLKHCTRPGFSTVQHGDGNNAVEFVGEHQEFVHVPGIEVGTGAGVTICDLDNKPASLEYVFTDGLAGCMAISIVGTRKGARTRDMFFCHARRWSNFANGEEIPANDPIYHARDFVRTHENLQVFYGTGDHKLDADGHFNPTMEAMKLSGILGVWVPSDRYHSLPLTPEMASLFVTPQWEPNDELFQALAKLSLPDKYLNGCSLALRAYAAGDIDSLRNLCRTAEGASQFYGEKLIAVMKRCESDMEQRGFGKQSDDRLQVDMNRSVGRQKMTAPRHPID